MEQLRGPVDRLGFSLYHAVSDVIRRTAGDSTDERRSFVVGSFSAAAAAALIYVGSGGATEENLLRVLHLENLFESRVTPELVMLAFRQAITTLTKRVDKHFPLDEAILYSGFQVYLANKVFLRVGTQCTSEFRANAKDSFDMDVDEIGCRTLTLAETRDQINEWVRVNTNGKIEEMLPLLTLEDCLHPAANMFLVNACCMRGKWDTPFPRERTQRRPFHSADGKTFSTEFMNVTGHFPFHEDEHLQVQYLELPYVNREASFCMVLPMAKKKKCGLFDLEGKLHFDSLSQLSTRKRLRTVAVCLPKFDIENTFDLKDLFVRVGMQSAFKDDADFSRMVESNKFHLAGAFHKVTMEIDETGTFSEAVPDCPMESEPATAFTLEVPTVGMPTAGTRPRATSFSKYDLAEKNLPDGLIKPTVTDVATFTADRPFMFAVRHNLSGVILFDGRVSTIPTWPPKPGHMKLPSDHSTAFMVSPKFLRKMARDYFPRPRRDSQ
ncbi:putative Serpin B10 [Hypsibius exemplaris]|uniref:Serpin B10 n=1 Tax=Hypsibius exemplaris TaxID=2072580 RepID=A0A9X6RLJ6_HYPEX|nr:putative Serpin B10 [Hypsibius exemplaris]